VWLNDPESYSGNSIAIDRVSHAREVKGDDRKQYSGSPGWGLGMKLTISSHKKSILSEPNDMPWIRERKVVQQQLWQRQLIVKLSAWSVQIYGCIKDDKEWRIRYNT